MALQRGQSADRYSLATYYPPTQGSNMQFVIDVHLHSRFARATSRELNPSNLHKWSALKGVDVVGTGDYTHPEWFAELSEQLEPAEEGLYQLESGRRATVEQELPERCRRAVRFMLSVEISTIYKKGDKTRKIHHVVILPSPRIRRLDSTAVSVPLATCSPTAGPSWGWTAATS